MTPEPDEIYRLWLFPEADWPLLRHIQGTGNESAWCRMALENYMAAHGGFPEGDPHQVRIYLQRAKHQALIAWLQSIKTRRRSHLMRAACNYQLGRAFGPEIDVERLAGELTNALRVRGVAFADGVAEEPDEIMVASIAQSIAQFHVEG